MSLYDTYFVDLVCPIDGLVISEWQGDDGPAAFYRFRFGRRHPEGVDESEVIDWSLWEGDDEDLEQARQQYRRVAQQVTLPGAFMIRAWHGDHHVVALGTTDPDGVWNDARVVEAIAYLETGTTRTFERADGEVVVYPDTEAVSLYRSGRILNDGLARYRAQRDRLRAQLSAYGGHATCQHIGLDGGCDRLAAGWAGRFLCDVHLAKAVDHNIYPSQLVIR
jgi:hypothetical protein